MSWVAVAVGAATLVGGLLADDNGAEGANDAAADASRMEARIAKEQWDFYKKNYQPLESDLISEAGNVGNAADQEQAAARAMATVAGAHDDALDNTRRTRMGFGVRPSSDAASAEDRQADLDRASAVATAGNDARENTKWLGRQYKLNLVGTGKGIPGQSMAGLGSSAATSAAIGANAWNRSRQQAQDTGYAIAPFAKAATDWFNKPKTPFAGKTPTSGYEHSPASFGSGSGYSDPYGLKDGGKVGVRSPDGEMEFGGPGVVHGPGSGMSDDVPALVDGEQAVQLSAGEFIIPADVVKRKGTEFFEKLIEKHHQPAKGYGVRRAS